MEAYYIEFYSPGTFTSEVTLKEVDKVNYNNVGLAKELARNIVERHGAKPYAFRFIKRARGTEQLDARVVERSCMYFLGGRVETLEDVQAKGPSILLSNMKNNGIARVLVNDNSYRSCTQMQDGDVVLEWP